MKDKHYEILLLIIVMGIQLYIPGKMIYDNQRLMNIGREFRFLTTPRDPYDVIRGKYINLNYRNSVFKTDTTLKWQRGESVYVLLIKGENGYATIGSITREPPLSTHDYVKAELMYSLREGDSVKIGINYPFNRYYMDEAKATAAEDVYMDAIRDTSQLTYAVVLVKDGSAILKDVMIGKKPIDEKIDEVIHKK